MVRLSLVFLFVSGCCLTSHGQQPSTHEQKDPALDESLAIYLGVGNVRGPGKIAQIGATGEVLGEITIESTPYGLAATKDFLFAVLPDAGKILRVVRNGSVTPLQSTGEISHPIAVALHVPSESLFVGDNQADRIVRIDPGQTQDEVISIHRRDRNLQSLTVAAISKSQVVVGDSNPRGVFIADFESGRLGHPILPEGGDVTVHLPSNRWAATQPNSVHLFEGETEIAVIPLPERTKFYRRGLLTFAPDGQLLAATSGPNGLSISLIDVDDKVIRPVCSWSGERLVSMAVSKRMTWNQPQQHGNEDKVRILSFDPPLPAVLQPGERLTVRVSYTLKSANHATIFVRPFTNGERTPGYGAHGSGRHPKGTRVVEGWFTFRNPAVIDQVRVSLNPTGENAVPLEKYFEATAIWRRNEEPDDN